MKLSRNYVAEDDPGGTIAYGGSKNNRITNGLGRAIKENQLKFHLGPRRFSFFRGQFYDGHEKEDKLAGETRTFLKGKRCFVDGVKIASLTLRKRKNVEIVSNL